MIKYRSIYSVFAICCVSVCTVFCNAPPKNDFQIYTYASIGINLSVIKKYAVDGGVYLGPPSIDVDDSGSIYLLNALDNAIEKYDQQGKLVWQVKNNKKILDIKTYKSSMFSFDGEKIFEYGLDSAKLIDTFLIALEQEEVTPVGNVSQFYGRYLFVNKLQNNNKKQLYVFDLSNRKLSPRVSDAKAFYPINNCSACSLSFVKELFENKTKIFVNQTDEMIVYFLSSTTQDIIPQINIFDKVSGQTMVLKKIPFFEDICFTSLRCILVDSRNDLICCTLFQEKYIPKRLVFYRINLNKK